MKFTVQLRIRLRPEQATSLRREARRRGLSPSEVLQEILDEHERRQRRRNARQQAREPDPDWLR